MITLKIKGYSKATSIKACRAAGLRVFDGYRLFTVGTEDYAGQITVGGDVELQGSDKLPLAEQIEKGIMA